MPRFNVYDAILEEAEEQEALDYAAQACWSEYETQIQDIKYARFIESVNGVGVYYDYAADYYFFTDDDEEDVS